MYIYIYYMHALQVLTINKQNIHTSVKCMCECVYGGHITQKTEGYKFVLDVHIKVCGQIHSVQCGWEDMSSFNFFVTLGPMVSVTLFNKNSHVVSAPSTLPFLQY